MLANQSFFKSTAGVRLELEVDGGLRALLPGSTPLYQGVQTFSSVQAQNTIYIMPELYAG